MSNPQDIIDLLDQEYPVPKINTNNEHIRNMLTAARKRIELDGDPADAAGVIIQSAANSSATTSYIKHRSSRGTIAARLPLLDNYILGREMYEGWDGDAFELGGQLICRATEDWDNTGHGTEFSIHVTPKNSVTPIEVMRWLPQGIIFPSYTTTERNAMTGMLENQWIWNTTNKRYEFWNGTSWRYIPDAAA